MAWGGMDGGLSGGLAIGADVPGAGETHHPRGVAVGGVCLGEVDKCGLEGAPLVGGERFVQQPVEVGTLAAREDGDGWLREPEPLPGHQLLLNRSVVPFAKKSRAGGDGCVFVATVASHQIDAAFLLLPAVGGDQIEATRSRPDAIGTGFRVPLAWVLFVWERTETCAGRGFAEEGDELFSLSPVNGGAGHGRASGEVEAFMACSRARIMRSLRERPRCVDSSASQAAMWSGSRMEVGRRRTGHAEGV